MKDFLHHNPFRKTNARNRSGNKQFVPEILDTDEDKVINQYEVYVSYIKRIKKGLVRGGEALLGYNRNNLATQ